MSSKLIRLEDGTLVEVEVSEDEVSQVNDGEPPDVSSSLDRVKPVLLKACRPIVSVWKELSQEMQIDQAEVEIGFSFEAGGNIYITRAKAASNLKVKLILKPKVE